MMSKLYPAQPLLIMLYGLPGSGKTYFARQLCERLQAAHVSNDRIRYELFDKPRYDKQENDVVNQLTNYMAEEFLKAGLSVAYDINAMRHSQRKALRELAKKTGAEPVLVWIQIDADSAITRALKRDRRKIDDKYSMPINKAAFQRLMINSQNPNYETETPVVISGKHVFNNQFNAFLKRLYELNLISSEAAVANVVKPGMVNLIPSIKAGRVDMTRRNITIK